MKHMKLLTILACLLCIQTAGAATIYRSALGSKNVYEVVIEGTIEPGDADKFIRTFFEEPLGSMSQVRLNSRGGDVREALQIAGIVQELSLFTRVNAQASCASACFFIWLSGSLRFASHDPGSKNFGIVGLHRPYLVSPSADSSSLQTQAALQSSIIKFLNGNLVPTRLIDAMMTRPSNDIYWLSRQDLKELGRHPAPIEELFINKCGYDRRNVDRWIELEIAGRKAEAAQLDAQMDKISECSAELTIEMRDKSLAAFETKYAPRFASKGGSSGKGTNEQEEMALVSRVHPDWIQIVRSPQFLAWSNRQAPEIQKLSSSPKAIDAIKMIDLYKAQTSSRP